MTAFILLKPFKIETFCLIHNTNISLTGPKHLNGSCDYITNTSYPGVSTRLYTKLTQYSIQHDLESLNDFTPNLTNNTNIKADFSNNVIYFFIKQIL